MHVSRREAPVSPSAIIARTYVHTRVCVSRDEIARRLYRCIYIIYAPSKMRTAVSLVAARDCAVREESFFVILCM